ncbi:DNA-binding CsgD family transcriptional regulator/PAS domain-containing protein [Novosphingobium hassiacum]|uniref:DNA-binding CsgD family transcriptional regulator/PAS domain-containing protein n=1 Tax=Novosphingobium hassiacum TaxID=173676 RepID=A0A7W6EWX2_9SPHN|nr:helix-turn-helix transcriptional regulator [Novosphingobium hassiacum]MBB3861289.1 DNA-binding CsgD family transcriptional regulator/PAS domain-containing protein [Novosphingobium hassiacum]
MQAELLSDFYGTAVDHARLTSALDKVRLRTNAMSATFHLFERTPERLRHRWQSSCSNTPAQMDRMALLDDLNPRTIAEYNPERTAPSLLEDHYLPDSFQPEVRKWQEQLRVFGMGRFLAARITLDAKREVGIALHGRIDGSALDEASSAFLMELMPHVREAVGLSASIAADRQTQRYVYSAMDGLRHGIITCDAQGTILSINPAAAALLSRACDQCAMGRFRIGGTVPRSLLGREDPGRRGRIFRWNAGLRELHVSTTKLHGIADQERSPFLGEGDAGWIVVLADLSARPAMATADYVLTFGISQAEAQLLSHLVMGGDVADFAIQRDVSIHTARSQLKALMSKMSASRQSDLVRLALAAPASTLVAAPFD